MRTEEQDTILRCSSWLWPNLVFRLMYEKLQRNLSLFCHIYSCKLYNTYNLSISDSCSALDLNTPFFSCERSFNVSVLIASYPHSTTLQMKVFLFISQHLADS